MCGRPSEPAPQVGDFNGYDELWLGQPVRRNDREYRHAGRAGKRRAGEQCSRLHHADVAASEVNPLEHYELFGWKEERDSSAGLDTLGYLAANPDIAAANMNPLDHYFAFGIYEGRQVVNDGIWH